MQTLKCKCKMVNNNIFINIIIINNIFLLHFINFQLSDGIGMSATGAVLFAPSILLLYTLPRKD